MPIDPRDVVATCHFLLGRKIDQGDTLQTLSARQPLDFIKRLLMGTEFAARVLDKLAIGAAILHDRTSGDAEDSNWILSTLGGDVAGVRTRLRAATSSRERLQIFVTEPGLQAAIKRHFEASPDYRAFKARCDRVKQALEKNALAAPGAARKPLFDRALLGDVQTAEKADELLGGLYQAHRHAELLCLHMELLEGKSFTPALAAHSQLYFARLALDLNASETAFTILSELAGDFAAPFFTTRTRHLVVKLAARAAARSGRPHEAIQLLEQQVRRTPTDWECYFHLGNLLFTGNPARRRFYFSLTERLEPRLSPVIRTALLEAMLHDGAIDEAHIATVTAARQEDFPEYDLSLANIYRARGDLPGWAFLLDKFFARLLPASRVLDEAGLTRFQSGATSHLFGAFGSAAPPLGAPMVGPGVCVIITCFNSAVTLAMAIRSVLMQHHANLELHVVDDCSTDESGEIAMTIARQDPRLHYHLNRRNVGTYCSKNKILLETRADFITFHDSDDWMHPERLSCHLRLMAEKPELVCSTSQWFRMDATGRIAVRRTGGYLHENPASIFLRREVVEEIGCFDGVRAGADSEFLWRMRRYYGPQKVGHLRLPLAIGLQHDASLTQGGSTAFDEHHYSPVRLRYFEAWVDWHGRALLEGKEALRLQHPNRDRRFAAPEEILVAVEDVAAA